MQHFATAEKRRIASAHPGRLPDEEEQTNLCYQNLTFHPCSIGDNLLVGKELQFDNDPYEATLNL
jgi:hypothetical protein